ncbi:MAG: twin-arginine translocation signal protein [Segetibacter sp.]|nr:twin-arginine translocation signal protein [Segetibacter sp.]
MSNRRREFLKLAALTGVGVTGGGLVTVFGLIKKKDNALKNTASDTSSATNNYEPDDKATSIIGRYGAWATPLNENSLPSFSYRSKGPTQIELWRKAAKQRLIERLSIPQIGGLPAAKIKKQYSYDGLHIEELNWQLYYGGGTEGILLKPINHFDFCRQSLT